MRIMKLRNFHVYMQFWMKKTSIECLNIYFKERNTKKQETCGLEVCWIQVRISSERLVQPPAVSFWSTLGTFFGRVNFEIKKKNSIPWYHVVPEPRVQLLGWGAWWGPRNMKTKELKYKKEICSKTAWKYRYSICL